MRKRAKRKQETYHKVHIQAKILLVLTLWALLITIRWVDGDVLWCLATFLEMVTAAVWVLGLNAIAYSLEEFYKFNHKHRRL